jgi:hypothetical protein
MSIAAPSERYTFKGNSHKTRYGWLRLTPAYSLHLVAELLDESLGGAETVVLDPFCGTGTTALVCAEKGVRCDTTDINDFLLWLAAAKNHDYTSQELADFHKLSAEVLDAILQERRTESWHPPLFQIEKWWDDSTLAALSRAFAVINKASEHASPGAINLLKVSFCRTLIAAANVSFGHQSMSFSQTADVPVLLAHEGRDRLAATWRKWTAEISGAASIPLRSANRFIKCDARYLTGSLPKDHYTAVITSPPYPNRMSYIRELRPYMYWLGYLKDGRAAGELDWQAIGGTWGCATSNLGKWVPQALPELSNGEFAALVDGIGRKSKVLATYVHKYFCDMVLHTRELYSVVKPGGTINYIVGNSKFYDVMVPVERIFASLFIAAGFNDVGWKKVRKRTSKKELYEFVVYGAKRDAGTESCSELVGVEQASRQLALEFSRQGASDEA